MPTYGPLLPTVAAQVDTGGRAWTGITEITVDNAQSAIADLQTTDTISDDLRGTSFGFSIPTGETIVGITATYDKNRSGGTVGEVTDNTIQLIIGGTPTGNNKASAANWSTVVGTLDSYGSTSDMWGTTLTPTQANATDFGIRIIAANSVAGDRNARVDYVSLTITTTAGNTIAVPALALTLAAPAPTVAVSDNKLVSVPALPLTLAALAPTVIVTTFGDQLITVPNLALTLAALAPVVAVSDHKLISVPPLALTLSVLAPTVVVTTGGSQLISVPPLSLTLAAHAPTVVVSGQATQFVGGGFPSYDKKAVKRKLEQEKDLRQNLKAAFYGEDLPQDAIAEATDEIIQSVLARDFANEVYAQILARDMARMRLEAMLEGRDDEELLLLS